MATVPARFVVHAQLDFGPAAGGVVLAPLVVHLHHADAGVLNVARRAVVRDLSDILARHREAIFSGAASSSVAGAPVYHGDLVSARFELAADDPGRYVVLSSAARDGDAGGGSDGGAGYRSHRLAAFTLTADVRHKVREVERKRATVLATAGSLTKFAVGGGTRGSGGGGAGAAAAASSSAASSGGTS
jgi:hypothetical protein